jgi:hypothetical protein
MTELCKSAVKISTQTKTGKLLKGKVNIFFHGFNSKNKTTLHCCGAALLNALMPIRI